MQLLEKSKQIIQKIKNKFERGNVSQSTPNEESYLIHIYKDGAIIRTIKTNEETAKQLSQYSDLLKYMGNYTYEIVYNLAEKEVKIFLSSSKNKALKGEENV